MYLYDIHPKLVGWSFDCAPIAGNILESVHICTCRQCSHVYHYACTNVSLVCAGLALDGAPIFGPYDPETGLLQVLIEGACARGGQIHLMFCFCLLFCLWP